MKKNTLSIDMHKKSIFLPFLVTQQDDKRLSRRPKQKTKRNRMILDDKIKAKRYKQCMWTVRRSIQPKSAKYSTDSILGTHL